MRSALRILCASAVAGTILVPALAGAQVTADAPAGKPRATVDLMTTEGVALVSGAWTYTDATIIEVDHRAPGPDLRASGAPIRTRDIRPHPMAGDFEAAAWQRIAPAALMERRGNGRLSFNWYRIGVTIPDRIASFDPSGSTAIFEIVVDDYAEIWVNGQLPVVLGQTGGALVRGFNSPNRVVLTRNARPGERFEMAIFGANAPLSAPPANFIWVRSATVDFVAAEDARVGAPVETQVVRVDPALNDIVPADAQIERLATGFDFIEGPVWVRDGGYLLFSDPNRNRIYRWTPDGEVSVYRTKSGYTGFDIGLYGQPGSNGLTLDADGRLTVAEHGNHRITRIERNGSVTVLAAAFDGRRLNSPNDLVYRSDGTLYFTDPPFGLPKFFEDPRKELPYSGVFLLRDGALRLVSQDLTGPNGLAFSPDEKILYVANWDTAKKVVMRYDVAADGTLSNGRVFFDMTAAPGEEALDGLKVDQKGNLYVSGPGGLWILSAEGRHLGTIRGPELAANFAWGDDDGRTLYMTARTGLYRIRLSVPGIRPPLRMANTP
ncbi:MAG: SMP-30/gluconolactonase/LRE family protein [Gemmatimonadetes bacterium]|nr:SMP-30/gluconolactonase/LRE family protein [Gemmatimonadota bacterium]